MQTVRQIFGPFIHPVRYAALQTHFPVLDVPQVVWYVHLEDMRIGNDGVIQSHFVDGDVAAAVGILRPFIKPAFLSTFNGDTLELTMYIPGRQPHPIRQKVVSLDENGFDLECDCYIYEPPPPIITDDRPPVAVD